MIRIFEVLGRATVRFRYLIVVAWIVGTVLAVSALPSLSSVVKDTNSGFLPADSPSMVAAALAAPFQDAELATSDVVGARATGLTAEDNSAIDAILARVKTLDHVITVLDLGISPDGQARHLLFQADVPQFGVGGPGQTLVDQVRATFTASPLPDGLEVHLGGQLAVGIDNGSAQSSSLDATGTLSGLLIIVLLVLAFRAPLAPIITLIPAIFVLVLSGPVIAESTKLGVEVSSITQFILVVLILGAGTDYGVFLVFRVREELRRGLSPHDAVARSVTRVGESISFSAFTVIVALVSLVLAEFGLYRTMGLPLAIGIALMLLAGLTLLPALLAIFGRKAFWPARTTPVEVEKPGLWERVGTIATDRPKATLAVGVALFVGLSLTLLGTGTAGFGDTTATAEGTDSNKAQALLSEHFPSAAFTRSAVLLAFPRSIWEDIAPVETASGQLAATPGFDKLIGPLNPTGAPISSARLVELHGLLGNARDLPPVPTDTTVDPAEYNAYRTTGQLISPDGRIVQFSVELAGGDFTKPSSLNQVPGIRADVERVAAASGATANGVFGFLTLSYDVNAISGADLGRIIPIVAILIGILLAFVIRSLVAPIYLVVSVILSYFAALGLTALIFVHIGGQLGLNFVLPFLMFVFLMALGSDYNILIMSRIREEAHDLPLRQAVALAVGKTGSTITTAGVILGGSFATLAIAAGGTAGGDQIQQIGYGVAAGVLLDSFLVRSLLVPSVVVLLGRWNWWPSHLSRVPEDVSEDEASATT
ncbi:MAG: MMPL family transporter [Candidatus Limnocylindrales bacterium]